MERRGNRLRGLWVVVVPAALAALLLALALSRPTDDPPEVAADGSASAGDVVRGQELYANNCATCHGADLQGTDRGPPHLHPVYEPSHHGDEAFRLAVARGAPQHHWEFGNMPAIGGLSEQDVTDIIAYVRAEQRAVGIE